MEIEVKVVCKPGNSAGEIRTYFYSYCGRDAGSPTNSGGNSPLTGFNELLDKLVQKAFDEGRKFERDSNKINIHV